MMLLAGKLNVKMIDAARPSDQGEYLLGDGGGLHLRIRPGGERGKKSWLFRYTNSAGEKKKLGLGVYPDVGLSQAREAALGMRQLVSAGKDPKVDKAEKRIAARTLPGHLRENGAAVASTCSGCVSLVGGPLE
jgi:hypothetical protein